MVQCQRYAPIHSSHKLDAAANRDISVFGGFLAAITPDSGSIMKSILFLCVLLLGWASAPLTDAESVIAPRAKLEKLAGDFAFTEGPTCDQAGNIFFVDQPNNRIMEWSVEGKLSTFMQPSGHANGMMFDAQGDLIACADEHNELWSIAPDKKVTVLIKDYQGKYLNGPNDVWVTPGRRDVYHRSVLPAHLVGSHHMALPNQEVFYLSPDAKSSWK